MASRSARRTGPAASPAATAAPTVPQMEVACRPARRRSSYAARARRRPGRAGCILVADRDGRQAARRGLRGLGDRERGGYDRRARVEYRRQMRVVEVERVGQGSVDQRRGRCRQPVGTEQCAGLGEPAAASSPRHGSPGRAPRRAICLGARPVRCRRTSTAGRPRPSAPPPVPRHGELAANSASVWAMVGFTREPPPAAGPGPPVAPTILRGFRTSRNSVAPRSSSGPAASSPRC